MAVFLSAVVLSLCLLSSHANLLIKYGSTTVKENSFLPLHMTDRAPTIDIQGYDDLRGLHPSYFSVVMFTWLDMIGFQFYESYITYWVANIPAGSFGPGKGKVVLPYMSPLATNKFLQFSAQNNSYSFALVPQGSNLVGPILDNRRSPALAKTLQHYNCTGDFIEIIDFTTSTSQS